MSTSHRIPAALRTVIPSFVLAGLLGAGSLVAVKTLHSGAGAVPSGQDRSAVRVNTQLEDLPLYFIQNKGQADPRVNHYIQGAGASMYFSPGGVTLRLSSPGGKSSDVSAAGKASADPPAAKRWAVRQEFLGANLVSPQGRDRTSAVVSYFKGSPEQWKTGIPTHSSIVYRDLWPGIDLTYEGTGGRLKYTFVVHPGADPSAIRLAYRGAQSVRLNGSGQLQVRTPIGGFRDDRPVAWQENSTGARTPVPAAYGLAAGGAYGFDVGAYDPGRPLVIDPVVLVYAGYIGGSASESAHGIDVDGSGAAYVTGATESLNFPATTGSLDTTNNGGFDAFVAKVNPAGTALVYATYIGGSDSDDANSVAVDGTGAAYITGITRSTESSTTPFPVTTGPDLGHNGMSDSYVAKVKADGTALLYAGYIGGSDRDEAYGIDVDGTGAAYITGYTRSSEATFPEQIGPVLTHSGGTDDAFVAKVKADGTGLVYAGYIGGSGDDEAYGIDVDGNGAAYVTGYTDSTETSFPEHIGPYLTARGGGDAFVAKVKGDGTGLDYAGYIGGSSHDNGNSIVVDATGTAFVTGVAQSSENSPTPFPVIVGPDLTHNGSFDAFVAKVTADGTTLQYAGYIGGTGNDFGLGIDLDETGAAYVAGSTPSTQATFPEKVGPDLTYNGGPTDAFVARVNTAGSGLSYAGYIGGSSDDRALDMAVDAAGTAYVAGEADSTQGTFPEKVGPDLTHNGGGSDAFVARVAQNNLLKNGDFELDANADNRPDSWTSNPRFTRSSDEVFRGSFAGKHQAADDSNYTIQQAVKASAGKTYNFEGYVNIPATADAFTFRIQIRWRNSSNATISTKTIKTYMSSTADWDLAKLTLKAPSGTRSALVRMVVSSLNATIYVDHFALI